jgi:Hsp70 protein
MAAKTDLRIIGFDLGHAETALAIVNDPQRDELNKLDLPCALGRRFVTVTAVAEHPDGVLIGFPAVDEPGVSSRYVAFKSPDVDQDAVARPITLFVAQMRDELVSNNLIPGGRRIQWVFGVPSGWGDPVVRRYKKVLAGSGLGEIEVVPESRAAMLYARDSGEIAVDPSRLSGAVLVVDLGSSTTDLTVVVELKVRPVDAGSHLGAGLIDKAIMGWVLDRHPQRDDLARWLEQDSVEESRLELACRWAKEDYFRNEAASRGSSGRVRGGWLYEPVRADGTVSFKINLTTESMTQILATPFPVLDGMTWPEKLRADLKTAADGLDRLPDLVLLTGSASRMPFVLDIARELFGDSRVVMGAEPELAIARGLALAGRIGVRAQGFRKDMQKLFTSHQVQTLVESRVAELAAAIGEAVANGFVKTFAVPAFKRWQAGEIRTLALLEQEISATVAASLAEPGNRRTGNVIRAWQNALRPDLAELTRPICDRWRIPRSALELEPVSLNTQEWEVSMGLSQILGNLAGNLAGWIAAVVVGVIAGALLGAGVLAGPVGWVVVGIGLVGSASSASDSAKEKITNGNVPLTIRRMFTEARVFKDAPAKERQLAANIASRITDEGADSIVAQVSRRLEADLKALADAAELMIS